jgi:hypothetical protein
MLLDNVFIELKRSIWSLICWILTTLSLLFILNPVDCWDILAHQNMSLNFNSKTNGIVYLWQSVIFSTAKKDAPRWFMVDVQFVRMLKRYIPLPELKHYHLCHKDSGGPLRNLALFTQARLSVQPIAQGKKCRNNPVNTCVMPNLIYLLHLNS